jgi:dCTP deaminase
MSKEKYKEFRPGVLNQEQIIGLKEHVIENLNDKDIDPSAFDLHLSDQGCEMKGSIKVLGEEDVDKITREYKINKLDNNGPWRLETGKTYIFQLKEYIKFPKDAMFRAKATGKSSIGRLDVLTRLMVNKRASFDTIDDKDDKSYEGSLYLEVTPITFPILVQEDEALAQLRIFRGSPEWSELKNEELPLFGSMILREDGQPKIKKRTELTVNLTPDKNGISAFGTKEKEEIKKENLTVDLTKKESSRDPKQYWTEIHAKNGTLEIEPERFYILRSKERFKLPPDVAVYCQAISETLGELRIHYAGFVHPGFGYDQKNGTPIIFEVRGHNVKVILRDGETLAHIKFYRMSQRCSKECLETKKTVYGDQELKLSKYFKDWV